MGESVTRFRVKFENERPIELLEFTASLAALGNEYRRFAGDEDGYLCVERITEGSIDAILADSGAILGSIVPIGPTVIQYFAEHWVDLLKTVANYGIDKLTDAKAKSLPSSSVKNVMTFAGPASKGNSTFVCGDNNTIVTGPTFNLDAATAATLIQNGRHLLSANPVEEVRFQTEPLKLYQVRDAKKGDLGYIDRFSPKAHRLIFADDSLKAQMLHGEVSPFDVHFFVSGIVKTAGGEIAAYYIDKIDGFTERDAA